MKTYIFEGYSDDTFGEYEQTDMDVDNCGNGRPIRYELKTPDGTGIKVTGLYNDENDISDTGCWVIGVSALDEHKPVDWKITLEPSYEGYCNRLTVIAPDEARLVGEFEEES